MHWPRCGNVVSNVLSRAAKGISSRSKPDVPIFSSVQARLLLSGASAFWPWCRANLGHRPFAPSAMVYGDSRRESSAAALRHRCRTGQVMPGASRRDGGSGRQVLTPITCCSSTRNGCSACPLSLDPARFTFVGGLGSLFGQLSAPYCWCDGPNVRSMPAEGSKAFISSPMACS